VLDVQNIAMRHGNNLTFNCIGIKIAIDYWKNKGHEVIGFAPDYLLNGRKNVENPEDPPIKACRLPDDVAYLEQLVAQGLLVTTPP